MKFYIRQTEGTNKYAWQEAEGELVNIAGRNMFIQEWLNNDAMELHIDITDGYSGVLCYSYVSKYTTDRDEINIAKEQSVTDVYTMLVVFKEAIKLDETVMDCEVSPLYNKHPQYSIIEETKVQ